MNEEQELDQIRKEIDGIDRQIHTLLNQRATCAARVAVVKQASATTEEAVFYRPEREAQVLRSIMERNEGPLGDEVVATLFREIMSACLALEAPQQVAYLGPEGTFTHAAVLKYFGHAVVSRASASIEEVFRGVESGQVNYGVIPVENSTEGMVNHTLDMFIRSPLSITGEVGLRIHQNLIVGGGLIDDIETVYSHEQSLAQCRNWLNAHLPNAICISVSSNAEAARIAAERGKGAAAIGGLMAAEHHGLTPLAKNIEDEPNNTTRFLVISKKDVPPSGQDKTSLLVSAHNQPGALFTLLEPLASRGISLTRIESRPSREGLWDYVFFIDIEGHRDEPAVAEALDDLQSTSAMFRVLGSYPQSPY